MKQDNVFVSLVDRYELWFKQNNHIFDSEISAVRQLLPETGRGIEIGVGTGLFAAALGIKEGIEPALEMAEMAVARGISVINAAAEKLPLNDGSFQFALMVTVDCFLNDVRQAFSEVWRILDNDGIFVIAFIDRATDLGRQYDKRKSTDEFYKYADFHSSEEMVSLLENTGFKIMERLQTIFRMENEEQEIRKGNGEGVFAVIKAAKVLNLKSESN